MKKCPHDYLSHRGPRCIDCLIAENAKLKNLVEDQAKAIGVAGTEIVKLESSLAKCRSALQQLLINSSVSVHQIEIIKEALEGSK